MRLPRLMLVLTNKISLGRLIIFNIIIVFTTILTIQFLESIGKCIIAMILIPLLLIFNYLFINQYIYRINIDKNGENLNKNIEKRKPVLNVNGKKYSFSPKSIIFLIFFCPLLSFLIFLFLNMRMNNWLQELMAKQTVFFLYVLFNIDSNVIYVPQDEFPWIIYLTRNGTTYRISNQCTGTQVFSIFMAIIICTPKSNSFNTIEKKDINWRKFKIFSITLFFFYSFNLIRMIFLIYLDYIGFSFSEIHAFINYFSGILAALIFVVFLWLWLPEFFISLYYIYPALKSKGYTLIYR